MMIIGIDGGGTKTKFALFTDEGKEIDSIVLASCHFMQVTYDEMEVVLKKGIEILCTKHNIKDFFVSAGMGGYGRDEKIRASIEAVFRKILPEGNFKLFSDAEIAVAGALGGHDGIVVIAGTGSIAYSQIDKKFSRTGGWGYLLGDEGSAYWLGKKALSVFCKEADGRLKKGPLYDCFMEYFKLKRDFDLIPIALEHLVNRTEVANLSKLVYQSAKLNDENSLKLFREVSDEIVCLIHALNDEQKQLNVSYAGGLFSAKEFILNNIECQLADNLKLVDPMYTPEKGAYLLVQD